MIAVDISANMLERAAKKASVYQGKLKLRQADVCELEFPDNSFDTVVTVCTFCSVPSPVTCLRELYRVLKPSGQILSTCGVASARLGSSSI